MKPFNQNNIALIKFFQSDEGVINNKEFLDEMSDLDKATNILLAADRIRSCMDNFNEDDALDCLNKVIETKADSFNSLEHTKNYLQACAYYETWLRKITNLIFGKLEKEKSDLSWLFEKLELQTTKYDLDLTNPKSVRKALSEDFSRTSLCFVRQLRNKNTHEKELIKRIFTTITYSIGAELVDKAIIFSWFFPIIKWKKEIFKHLDKVCFHPQSRLPLGNNFYQNYNDNIDQIQKNIMTSLSIYTGREKIRKNIDYSILIDSDKIIYITGAPGIGKTSLCHKIMTELNINDSSISRYSNEWLPYSIYLPLDIIKSQEDLWNFFKAQTALLLTDGNLLNQMGQISEETSNQISISNGFLKLLLRLKQDRTNLLLVIDGIDESPIKEFLPERDRIPDGITIILSGRTKQRLNECFNEKIHSEADEEFEIPPLKFSEASDMVKQLIKIQGKIMDFDKRLALLNSTSLVPSEIIRKLDTNSEDSLDYYYNSLLDSWESHLLKKSLKFLCILPPIFPVSISCLKEYLKTVDQEKYEVTEIKQELAKVLDQVELNGQFIRIKMSAFSKWYLKNNLDDEDTNRCLEITSNILANYLHKSEQVNYPDLVLLHFLADETGKNNDSKSKLRKLLNQKVSIEFLFEKILKHIDRERDFDLVLPGKLANEKFIKVEKHLKLLIKKGNVKVISDLLQLYLSQENDKRFYSYLTLLRKHIKNPEFPSYMIKIHIIDFLDKLLKREHILSRNHQKKLEQIVEEAMERIYKSDAIKQLRFLLKIQSKFEFKLSCLDKVLEAAELLEASEQYPDAKKNASYEILECKALFMTTNWTHLAPDEAKQLIEYFKNIQSVVKTSIIQDYNAWLNALTVLDYDDANKEALIFLTRLSNISKKKKVEFCKLVYTCHASDTLMYFFDTFYPNYFLSELADLNFVSSFNPSPELLNEVIAILETLEGKTFAPHLLIDNDTRTHSTDARAHVESIIGNFLEIYPSNLNLKKLPRNCISNIGNFYVFALANLDKKTSYKKVIRYLIDRKFYGPLSLLYASLEYFEGKPNNIVKVIENWANEKKSKFSKYCYNFMRVWLLRTGEIVSKNINENFVTVGQKCLKQIESEEYLWKEDAKKEIKAAILYNQLLFYIFNKYDLTKIENTVVEIEKLVDKEEKKDKDSSESYDSFNFLNSLKYSKNLEIQRINILEEVSNDLKKEIPVKKILKKFQKFCPKADLSTLKLLKRLSYSFIK